MDKARTKGSEDGIRPSLARAAQVCAAMTGASSPLGMKLDMTTNSKKEGKAPLSPLHALPELHLTCIAGAGTHQSLLSGFP